MRGFALSIAAAAVVGGWLATAPAARAEDRTGDQILKEIQGVAMPDLDQSRQNDRTYVAEFLNQRREAMGKRAALIGELYKVDPANKEVAKLMLERWRTLASMGPAKAEEVKKELEDVQANAKSESLRNDAAFFKVLAGQPRDPEALQKGAEEFIKFAPKDNRGAQLLNAVAGQTEDKDKKEALLQRIAKDYPKSPTNLRIVGALKRKEGVGKPFDLEFTDAVNGSEVSMKALKGKVVVVDFWATWCGPCVAEMPNMKKLYAEYKDKGVEFIGVSLDQPKEDGGLDKLKAFVAKNDIQWPQYYQGNFWESEFSSSWGIDSIPAVFVIDADGKIASTDARGKLETLIPELLKKAKAGDNAGSGGQ